MSSRNCNNTNKEKWKNRKYPIGAPQPAYFQNTVKLKFRPLETLETQVLTYCLCWDESARKTTSILIV